MNQNTDNLILAQSKVHDQTLINYSDQSSDSFDSVSELNVPTNKAKQLARNEKGWNIFYHKSKSQA